LRLTMLASISVLSLNSAVAASAFDFADVVKRAEQLARAAYQKPGGNLPKELQALSYDQYWSMRIKPDRTYWRGAKLPFELGFFPEGMYYDQAVKINEVAPDGVREIRFDPDLFDTGPSKLDPNVFRGLGFAGFSVRYPLNSPDSKDEVLTF